MVINVKKYPVVIFILLFIVSIFIGYIRPVRASSCQDLSIIFSRGSGQNQDHLDLDDLLNPQRFGNREKQSYTFFKEVDAKLPGLTKEFVSLHDFASKYNNYGYKAVSVMPSMVEPASHRNDSVNLYYESVKDGTEELTGYIKDKIAECPDQELILGGYSQGAQITGETLFKLTSQERSHIRYTAFYGDPKLNGHEGSFVLNKGPWLRGNSLRISKGILGAREKYIPDDMKDRVGSWCDFADPICSGQSISMHVDAQLTPLRLLADKFMDRTHSDIYQGKWIPSSANEIASKISPQSFLDKNNNYTINYSANNRDNDITLVMDISGSMAGSQSYIRLNRDAIAQNLFNGKNTQVRFTKYANKYTEPAYFQENFAYSPAPLLVQSRDLSNLLMTNNTMSPHKTGYSPLYNGLHQAVITQKQYGRNVPTTNKNFIVVTNAKPSPEYVFPNPNMDKEYVLRELLELDPVAVSFLVLPDAVTGNVQAIPEYNEVAKATGGNVVTLNKLDDIGTGIQQLTKQVTSSPIAIINSEYNGENTVMLSAGDSYDTNSYITKYKWDCNDDGIWDIEDVQPNASCEYSTDYNGLVVLEVESFDGQNSKAIHELNIVHKQQVNNVVKFEKPNVQIKDINKDTVNFLLNNEYPDGTVYKVYDEDNNLLDVTNNKEIFIENTKDDVDSKYGFIAQKETQESEIAWVNVAKLAKIETPIVTTDPVTLTILTEQKTILDTTLMVPNNLVSSLISPVVKSIETSTATTITKPTQDSDRNVAYVDGFTDTKPIGTSKPEGNVATTNKDEVGSTNVLGDNQTKIKSNPTKAIIIFAFIIGLISLVIYLSNRKYRNT